MSSEESSFPFRHGDVCLSCSGPPWSEAKRTFAESVPARPRRWVGRALSELRFQHVRPTIRRLAGPPHIELDRDQLVALTLVRNGALWVRSYLEHHFALGVAHVVLLDNGSTDETLAIARSYDRVTILRSVLPFGRFKREMRLYLLRRFARDRWSLNLDIDELFDYPHSGSCSLPELLAYLDRRGFTAVVTYMLDLFADGPLGSVPARLGDRLLELYPYYDLACLRARPYEQLMRFRSNRVADPELPWYEGGIRRHLFGAEVNLTKHSLLFFGRGVVPGPIHRAEHADIADLTGVLYHFKFLKNLQEFARQVAQEGSYFRRSELYRAIVRELSQRPNPVIRQPSSRRLEGTDELLEVGFLRAPEALLS